jgi:hypothetical protein
MATNPNITAEGYIGRYRRYWDYTNRDSGGLHTRTCCGQAAVYSALRTMGSPGITFPSFVRKYPPNVLGGTLGSSKELIKEMVLDNGCFWMPTFEESGLRLDLLSGPVIVCLDINAAGNDGFGLHWVTVFGYSASRYYLSNWTTDSIPRHKFIAGWNTALTTWASGTNNEGYRVLG